MRLVFAGTPEFARAALQRLCEAGHDVRLVLTQPDRPAGRGMKLQASPVKAFALAQGIAVAQPRGLRLDGRFADDVLHGLKFGDIHACLHGHVQVGIAGGETCTLVARNGLAHIAIAPVVGSQGQMPIAKHFVQTL